MRLRRMKNAATSAIPASAPRQTIHQHSTNWPGIIAVSVLCGMVLLAVFWFGLVFLFDQLGFREPGHRAALTIFGLLVIAIAGILAREIIGYLIEKWFDGRVELQQVINDGLRYQQLMAQNNVANPRQISENTRLAKLVMRVMWQAYDDLYRNGKYGPNDSKPWSRRSVADMTIKGEDKPVGETVINGKVKRALQAEKIIIDNQINIDDFPDLDAVRVALERRFNMPVKVYSNSLPPQGVGFGEFIEK